jgi:zinc D-Ala-D-Ala carboxypeptidase
MNLSPHFTLEELTHSELAARRGIDNTPPADVLPRLVNLAHCMELVRDSLGAPPDHQPVGLSLAGGEPRRGRLER